MFANRDSDKIHSNGLLVILDERGLPRMMESDMDNGFSYPAGGSKVRYGDRGLNMGMSRTKAVPRA